MSSSVTACDKLGAGVPLAERPFEREVLASSQPRAAHIDDAELDDAERQMLTAAGAGQCIAAPARLGGEPVGLLQVCETSDGRRFGSTELAFVEGLAAQVALALRNA
jgi:GAF domain-containing protein